MKKKPTTYDFLKLELPKQRKRRFFKAVILLSFFVGGNMIIDKILEKPKLPFNDDQVLPELPDTTFDELEQLEFQIALDAYQMLLNKIYLKSSQMGVALTPDYKVKIVAYDLMTDTIDVILQSSTTTAHLKFSVKNLSVMEDKPTRMSDQISQLTILLNAPILQVPTISTFPQDIKEIINENMNTTINYYAASNVQLSEGNVREEFSDSNLISGRDYYFFNVYGFGQKNGVNYNIVTTIAMKVDDYEIAGVENLIEFYKKNPTDARLVINTAYQESQNTLQKLNDRLQKSNESAKPNDYTK